MRRLLARALTRLPRRGHRWQETPDHEHASVLCRLAWHRWAVTTVLDTGRDDVVGRTRECRDCGVIEEEVRL